MNMPALSAAINLRLSNPLARMPSLNAQNAKAQFRRFIQMLELFSRVLVFIKQIQDQLNLLQLLLLLLRHLLKMISRDVVADLPEFQHRALSRHLRGDQFHLASLSAKYSDRS